MLFIRPDIGKPFVFALVNYVDIRCHDAEQRSVRGDFRGCDSEPTRRLRVAAARISVHMSYHRFACICYDVMLVVRPISNFNSGPPHNLVGPLSGTAPQPNTTRNTHPHTDLAWSRWKDTRLFCG